MKFVMGEIDQKKIFKLLMLKGKKYLILENGYMCVSFK